MTSLPSNPASVPPAPGRCCSSRARWCRRVRPRCACTSSPSAERLAPRGPVLPLRLRCAPLRRLGVSSFQIASLHRGQSAGGTSSTSHWGVIHGIRRRPPRARPVEGVRALVHGHQAVVEVECTANRQKDRHRCGHPASQPSERPGAECTRIPLTDIRCRRGRLLRAQAVNLPSMLLANHSMEV